MDILRWLLLLASLAVLTWLHVLSTREAPAQRALPNAVSSLRALADQVVVAGDSAGSFHLWSMQDLTFQRELPGSRSNRIWHDQNLAVSTVSRSQFERLNLISGRVETQTNFGSKARVAGFDQATNEVLVLHNKLHLRAYDAVSPTISEPTREIPIPGDSATKGLPLTLHRSPAGSFAMYQQGSGALWLYDAGGSSMLTAINRFEKTPRFTWSEDGRALIVRSSNTSPFHTVSDGVYHQWRLPEYPRHSGIPQLQQVTRSLLLFKAKNGLELRGTTSGQLLHSLQYPDLQTLPPLDPKHGHPEYPCVTKLSNNARYLLLQCNYKKQLTTSLTDLQSMQTRQLASRTGKHYATQHYVDNDGLSIIAYGNTIDLVRPGQVELHALTNPALTKAPEPNSGWWIYRAVVLSMVLFLAIAMSRTADEQLDAKRRVALAQFQILKTIGLFLIPLGLIFALFAYYVMGNEHADYGIMSPGIALGLIGIFGLGAIATFTKLAVYVAGAATTLTQGLKLQPANATPVVAAMTCLALLFVPFLM